MVDLDSIITVSMEDGPSGMPSEVKMTEYEARVMLEEFDIPRPPVLCYLHDPLNHFPMAMARA